MKRCFIVGLMTLLPVLVTYIVIVFLIGLITRPFDYVVTLCLEKSHLFDNGVSFLSEAAAIAIVSKLLILLTICLLIYSVGFIAHRFVSQSWVHYFDELMRKIPFVRSIYGPSKELIHTFLNPPAEVPRHAALVPYPSAYERTLGIVTGEYRLVEQEYVSVFIPSTPNATNGYLCNFLKSDITLVDVPADEALKYVLSFANTRIAIKE